MFGSLVVSVMLAATSDPFANDDLQSKTGVVIDCGADVGQCKVMYGRASEWARVTNHTRDRQFTCSERTYPDGRRQITLMGESITRDEALDFSVYVNPSKPQKPTFICINEEGVERSSDVPIADCAKPRKRRPESIPQPNSACPSRAWPASCRS